MLKPFLKWAILLLLISAAGYAVWQSKRPEPLEVVLKTATRGVVERTVANTRAGTVKACRRAKLSPSIGGQIANIPIHKGDVVKKGQLLLELWNKDIVARVQLAQKEVASARSRSRAACLKADIARKNAARLAALRRSAAVSEEQTETADTEAESLQAECLAGKNQVKVSEAQLAVVQANLSRTRLEAPFDGVVAEINGELYEYVTPSPVGVPTLPAVDILENSCFYVTAPIDEVDAADIRVRMLAKVTLDAFRGRIFEGRVRRIADYVLDLEKQARTVDVEVGFSRPEDLKLLLAGYSADIEVIVDAHRDVVRIPTESVVADDKVYLFDPGKRRIRRVTIETGLSNWDFTEVRAGVTPGDLVVVNVDKPGLADGVSAHPVEEGGQ